MLLCINLSLLTLVASFGDQADFASSLADYRVPNRDPYAMVANLFNCFKSENVSAYFELVKSNNPPLQLLWVGEPHTFDPFLPRNDLFRSVTKCINNYRLKGIGFSILPSIGPWDNGAYLLGPIDDLSEEFLRSEISNYLRRRMLRTAVLPSAVPSIRLRELHSYTI